MSEQESSRAIAPEDDFFHHHSRARDPWWNESSWVSFMIPEERINAYFYHWHRPNMKLTAGGVALWDTHGTERHNCLYSNWYDFNPMAPDTDMFNYELANGQKCELVKPLETYRYSYRSDECQLDLVWNAKLPAQNLHYSGEYDVIGAFHYEQVGWMTGTVTVRGRTLTVDCPSARDLSRGTRAPLRNLPGGGLEFGWASDRTSFLSTMTRPDPSAPVLGESVDVPGYGHFVKDGQIGRITSGRRRVVERAADGRPLRIVIDLVDERGRELHAEGRVENCLKYHSIWFVHWGLVKWDTIDGEPGWGESQDWFDIAAIRAHQRAVLGATS